MRAGVNEGSVTAEASAALLLTDGLAGARGTLRETGRVAFHSIAGSVDYSQVSEAVGGVVWSVDNTPYGPPLQAMTDMIDPTLLVLSAPAVQSSIEVRIIDPDLVETVASAADYVYDSDENAVEMVKIPENGNTLEITYEVAP